ncbi:MAG TPA: hypothetical protein DD735_03880 [Clostridiales bacterium]|nr:hypothetical protein [Clostridiales bacterium]HBR08024.1 hypothetical protein [Clostridiales bacterium]
MADPATIGLAVKAAVTALSDERLRKTIGWIIAAILSPLILIVVLICGLLSGGADHNNAAVDLCYYGGTISGSVPEEYRQYIEDMQSSFASIDSSIASVSAMTENGSGLDSHRVKAIFYALYFGIENPSHVDIARFVDCFVTYEDRTDTWTDEDGTEHTETYTVAIPIASLDTIYANISSAMGMEITTDDRKNADSIYSRTSSGGDTFSGSYESGGEQSIELDVSTFVDITGKNNLDLVTYAVNAWESGWGYVWGTYGSVLTDSLFEYKLEQYPDGVGNYEDFIRENWLGGRTTDCVGLIKGYGWLDPDTLTINYGTNGMPDVGADQMYNNATVKGDISTMPDIPGLAVWHKGHIGVYIGNGEVIEAMGTKYGVVKTKLADRSFTAWLEVPYISYITDSGE